MSFVKGAVTVSWYRGLVAEKSPERVIAALAASETVFKPLSGSQRESIGWVDPVDLTLPPTFDQKTCPSARFVFASLRRDSRKPHPDVLKSALKRELATEKERLVRSGEMKQNENFSKDEIATIKELTIDRLIPTAPTTISTIPVLIDLQRDEVFIGASSGVKCGLAEGRISADLKIAELVPVTSGLIVSEAALESDVKEDETCGEKFLLWLVSRARDDEKTIEIGPGKSVVVVLDGSASVRVTNSESTKTVRVSGNDLSFSDPLIVSLRPKDSGGSSATLESLSVKLSVKNREAVDVWQIGIRARDLCVTAGLPVRGKDSLQTRFIRGAAVSELCDTIVGGLFRAFLADLLSGHWTVDSALKVHDCL